MRLFMLSVLVSASVLFSPYSMCLVTFPPFEKELLFVICLCNIGFTGGTFVLNATLPGHCLPFIFATVLQMSNELLILN